MGVAEPVDWLGNAWGGHVGLRFAVAYPGEIRSLVTLGTPVQALSATERLRTRTLLLAHRVVGPAGFIADALVDTMLSPATRARDPEAVALVRDTFIRADRGRLRNAVSSISLQREDLAALLPGVAVPTLMITGEQHTGWTPAAAAAAVNSLPDGQFAVVPDAAYLVPLEQPALVVDLVSNFWSVTRERAADDRRSPRR